MIVWGMMMHSGPDLKACIGPPSQKAVKPDKYGFTQIRLDDFSAMGRDIVALQHGIDDVAVFLGVGALSKG